MDDGTIAILFFAVTQLVDGAFLGFVIYEAAGLSFALLGYLWLGLIRQRPGAGLMTAGILVTLAAAAIQATRLVPQISVVWTFDHNGLFHIVQMLGVVLILSGLRAAILHRPVGRSDSTRATPVGQRRSAARFPQLRLQHLAVVVLGQRSTKR